jgi:hypothetical protein
MLSQFLSNNKMVVSENNQYFNISPKQKLILDLKKNEENIIKEASQNIRKSLLKV